MSPPGCPGADPAPWPRSAPGSGWGGRAVAAGITLALGQVVGSRDPGENLAAARRLAAAARGADLLALPEMFMAAPGPGDRLTDVAEPLDGPFVRTLGRLARAHELFLLAPVWEAVAGEHRVGNTAVLLAPDGTVAATYRKFHLFDALGQRESDRMLPGDAPPPVVAVGGMPLGFALCYDLRFPELFRHLVDGGAEAVVVPAAWYAGPHKADHWHTLLRARAIENTAYVAGVGLAGERFCGQSTWYDPFGLPGPRAGGGEELLLGTIDRSRISDVRRTLPCLEHRRLGGTRGQGLPANGRQ